MTRRNAVAFIIVCTFVSAMLGALWASPSKQHPHACWTESKSGTQFMPERICGDVSKAPMDAVLFGDTP